MIPAKPDSPIYRIRVGHLNVGVMLVEDSVADVEEMDGCYLPAQQTILIRESLSPEEHMRVLLHELIHAMYGANGWADGKKLSEEECCSRLDRAFAKLFMDNPQLLLDIYGLARGFQASLFEKSEPHSREPQRD